MSAFSLIVIMSVLMIIGGISLMATPLITFMSAGYFIIIMFFLLGIFGIVRGIIEKRFDKKFFLSILSLILGIVGLFVPGAAEMNNYILLYMAAFWFFIHGIMTIIDAIDSKRQGEKTIIMVLGIILGVLELILAGYSVAHPGVLAVSLGFLIGFYFIESGVNAIIVGTDICKGGNSTTVFFTFMGVLTIIGGISLLVTPLMTFLSAGYCIILLFFIYGVVGIIRALAEQEYGKEFFFSILSLILGIVGCAVPGAAAMNNYILLYIAAAWFLIHGVMTIVDAIADKKKGAGTGIMILGIVLGVLELILAAYSIAHPSLLAVGLGVMIAVYFIESGANMILIGSRVAKAVAAERDLQNASIRYR